MAMQSYFVVQPYHETSRGALVPLPPIAAKDAGHAVRLISSQKRVAVGAIAFSRRADPETGDYEDAVVLSCWGKVPEDDIPADAAA